MAVNLDQLFEGATGNKTFTQMTEEIQKSVTPNDSTLATFSEEQIQQLQLAEQHGMLNTECRKHPEWSSGFMNVFWNREKEGKPVEPMYTLAEYLREHKLPEDIKTGKIGSNIDATLVLLNMLEASLQLPDEFPTTEFGDFDSCMFYFTCYRDLLIANGAEQLMNDRVVLGSEVSSWQMKFIMSEGIQKARDIVQSIEDINSQKTERGIDMRENPEGAMAENAWARLSITLSIDDMGIRGRQLVDALEYCDGSTYKLWEFFSNAHKDKSRGLVDYVNTKAADRIKNGISQRECIAVTSGASFDYYHKDPTKTPWAWYNEDAARDRYIMNIMNYDDYLKDVVPLSVDYSALDIGNGCSMESAERICEAHGFELVRKLYIGESWKKKTYYMLFRNRQTGDFVEFDSATEDESVYGGAKMIVYRKTRLPFEMTMHCSSGGLNEQDGAYYEFTHHDGLFKNYEHIAKSATKDQIDWSKLGFGSYGMPVPVYWKHPYHQSANLWKTVGGEIARMWDGLGSYHLQLFMCKVLMEYDKDNFNLEVFPELEYFWQNPAYYAVNDMSLWNIGDIPETLTIIRIALAFLKAPNNVIERYDVELSKRCQWIDERRKEKMKNATPYELKQMEDEETASDSYANSRNILYNGIENEAYVIEHLELGNPAELPVKLPWLQ